MGQGSGRRIINWLFRNRTTGRITIAQSPNLALGLFLVATAGRWVVESGGGIGTALGVVATGALIWWSVDEVVRGVNPWRRLLGATVFAAQVISYIT